MSEEYPGCTLLKVTCSSSVLSALVAGICV